MTPPGRRPPTVALHPEATQDPSTVRWVVPAELIGFVGPVGACPAPLEELRVEGVVSVVEAAPSALLVTLAPDRSWRSEGGRVRTALHEALGQVAAGLAHLAPAATTPLASPDAQVTGTQAPDAHAAQAAQAGAPADTSTSDAHLRAATTQVLAGDVGDYLNSHGGGARIVSVSDGVVTLALDGACGGCPARGLTLQQRLAAAIEKLAPQMREVRLADGPPPPRRPGLTRTPLTLRTTRPPDAR